MRLKAFEGSQTSAAQTETAATATYALGLFIATAAEETATAAATLGAAAT